jgi:tol-pal system protein YbgF
MPIKRPSFFAAVSALSLMAAALWPLQAHALFDDDEARKAIIDLRNKFDAHKLATENTLGRLTRQAEDGNAAGQRSLIELSNQNEQLRAEMARLQGQIEQLQRDVMEIKGQQKSAQAAADERRRLVEPAPVVLDGQSFSATPDETRDFDNALALLRKADFGPAEAAFAGMLRRFPATGYLPSVLYWLGNAQYANRAYASAIASHQRLVQQFPDHLRAPEAMLAMANSQVELKESKAARLTLGNLVKSYPDSEAAAAARERLAKLR